MGSLEMTCLDLECGGGHGSSAVSNDCKDVNLLFSKAEEGPCSSQSYSAADSSNQGQNSDSEIDQVSHSTRVSSVVATDCVVDIDQDRVDEVRISVERMERECRICMLSLDSGSGSAIELGCSCKNELAAVHQHCAETWFRSKGNKICEICKSIAQNVDVPNCTKSRQQNFEVNRFSTNAISVPVLGRNASSSTNASSTDASSVSELEPDTISRNADLEPVSSNSDYERLVLWILYGCLLVSPIGLIIVLLIVDTVRMYAY